MEEKEKEAVNKSEEKKEENEKKTEEKKEDAPVKKARRLAPKFNAQSLLDPEKGLDALYKKVERLNHNIIHGDKESLAMLMRIYQQWIFQLFPADFGDMCWKLNETSAVKNIVRNYVFEKKGRTIVERILDDENFIDNDDENNDENEYNGNSIQSRYLDDDDDDDIELANNQSNQISNNNPVPENNDSSNKEGEILDVIGRES